MKEVISNNHIKTNELVYAIVTTSLLQHFTGVCFLQIFAGSIL